MALAAAWNRPPARRRLDHRLEAAVVAERLRARVDRAAGSHPPHPARPGQHDDPPSGLHGSTVGSKSDVVCVSNR